jgi:hypothetical protein
LLVTVCSLKMHGELRLKGLYSFSISEHSKITGIEGERPILMDPLYKANFHRHKSDAEEGGRSRHRNAMS